jgi:enamine deaminase RidA (YjgF/YER057c/UK114 family)
VTARTRAFSGAPWERKVGYCRALRTGDRVFVTGTASVAPDGGVFASGDAYRQTVRCLDIIEEALAELGARMEDVVRTRMFVTDIGLWEAVGRAHGERFGNAPPCTTLVEVSGLIDPDMLVEIEADAVLDR